MIFLDSLGAELLRRPCGPLKGLKPTRTSPNSCCKSKIGICRREKGLVPLAFRCQAALEVVTGSAAGLSGGLCCLLAGAGTAGVSGGLSAGGPCAPSNRLRGPAD